MKWFPLLDLVVRTPRLELRYPSDDDLDALAAEAALGVHEPGFMPFGVSWTRLPSPALERGVQQYHWRARGEWTPDDWRLELAVVVDGVPVGTQGAHAKDFGVVRTATTGSWIGLRHQGQGIGKEMRSAMLHLVFAGLGAERALSSAREDNGPSVGVSTALGYEDNGYEWLAREGEVCRDRRFVMTRQRWEERARRDDVVIEGLQPCLELFGVRS